MVTDNFFKEEDNGDNEIDYLNFSAEIENVNQENEQNSSSESRKTKKKKALKNKEYISEEIVSMHIYLPKSLQYRMKGVAYFSHQTMSQFVYECILDGIEKFVKEQNNNLEDYVKTKKESK